MKKDYSRINFVRRRGSSVLQVAARLGQKGFSLIELMVALAIIGILSTLVAGLFSGDSSKATKLLADMTTIKNSVSRAKFDMGGIPRDLSILWSRDAAVAAGFFNGINGTSTWSGPYLERQAGGATALDIGFPTIADGTSVAILREDANAANGGNLRWVYFLRATGVPSPIISEFMKKCAGTDGTTDAYATFLSSPCRTTSAAADEIGSVDIRIADSR